MNALAVEISNSLHLLTEGDSFEIAKSYFGGSITVVLATVTRADFEAVAEGNSLEDILSCTADIDWVAVRLAKRCAK